MAQSVFVTCLRCRENEKIVTLLVFDQCLVQVGFTLNHIDEVIHHTALTAHDQVQIAQTHIKINHNGFKAPKGQACSKTGAGGGFTHTPLTGSHNNYFCHG